MSNSEESPRKKMKMEASPETSLPDHVAMSFLARLSRSDLAALSLVSKRYRSLVASPDLYKTRSLMGLTETYVYVCLRYPPPDLNPRWYILRRRKTLDASSSDLIPIPSLLSQAPEASSVAVLDWGIYVIGGLIGGEPTSDVWLLDCRTHTWRRVPSMGVARSSVAAGVVGGKIYVLGGCDVYDPCLSWGEVFDPKTQTWDFLPGMRAREKHDQYIHGSVVRDQKVYAVDGEDKTLYYSPREGKWGRGNRGQAGGNRRDWCMIDDVLYCISAEGNVFWCEPDELDWRGPKGEMVSNVVNGLGSLKKSLSVFRSRLRHFDRTFEDIWDKHKLWFDRTGKLEDLLPGARLSNSGGKNIVLFWDVIEGDRLEIWCAEISLERRPQGGGEMWGNVEWSNAVMTVDPFLDHYKKALSQGYEDCTWTLQTKTGRYAGEVRLILHYAEAKKHNYGSAPAPSAPYAPQVPQYSAPPSPSPYSSAPYYGPSLYPQVQYSQPQSAYPPASAYPPQPSAYPPPSTSAYPPVPSAYPHPPPSSAYPPPPYPLQPSP